MGQREFPSWAVKSFNAKEYPDASNSPIRWTQLVGFGGENPAVPNSLIYQANWLTLQIGGKWLGFSPGRIYDIEIGAFLSRDPLSKLLKLLFSARGNVLGSFQFTKLSPRYLAFGSNAYQYILSSPTSYVDPTGNECTGDKVPQDRNGNVGGDTRAGNTKVLKWDIKVECVSCAGGEIKAGDPAWDCFKLTYKADCKIESWYWGAHANLANPKLHSGDIRQHELYRIDLILAKYEEATIIIDDYVNSQKCGSRFRCEGLKRAAELEWTTARAELELQQAQWTAANYRDPADIPPGAQPVDIPTQQQKIQGLNNILNKIIADLAPLKR
jgi:hypothetical protein